VLSERVDAELEIASDADFKIPAPVMALSRLVPSRHPHMVTTILLGKKKRTATPKRIPHSTAVPVKGTIWPQLKILAAAHKIPETNAVTITNVTQRSE